MRISLRILSLLLIVLLAGSAQAEAPEPHRFMDIPYGLSSDAAIHMLGTLMDATPQPGPINGSTAHRLLFSADSLAPIFGYPAAMEALIGKKGLMEISIHYDDLTTQGSGDRIKTGIAAYGNICWILFAQYGPPTYGQLTAGRMAGTQPTLWTYDYPFLPDGSIDEDALCQAFAGHDFVTAKLCIDNIIITLSGDVADAEDPGAIRLTLDFTDGSGAASRLERSFHGPDGPYLAAPVS